eukprot:COSAG02_NODE_1195_length_13940_cov_15.482407_11_plen_113_part_00
MVGAIDASTYEGIATTLFGHSQPVRTLVWSLQSKGLGHKIGWDEFIAFAEHDDHIPSTAEEWEKIVEVLGACCCSYPMYTQPLSPSLSQGRNLTQSDHAVSACSYAGRRASC